MPSPGQERLEKTPQASFSLTASNVLASPPLWLAAQVLPPFSGGRPWIHGKKSRLCTAPTMKRETQQADLETGGYVHRQAPCKPTGLSSLWVAGTSQIRSQGFLLTSKQEMGVEEVKA